MVDAASSHVLRCAQVTQAGFTTSVPQCWFCWEADESTKHTRTHVCMVSVQWGPISVYEGGSPKGGQFLNLDKAKANFVGTHIHHECVCVCVCVCACVCRPSSQGSLHPAVVSRTSVALFPPTPRAQCIDCWRMDLTRLMES